MPSQVRTLAAKALPVSGGPWTEADDAELRQRRTRLPRPGVVELRWRSRLVSGRVTALARRRRHAVRGHRRRWCLEAVRRGTWSAAASTIRRRCRSARCAVDPSHGLWVGTGEANTSSDSYAGIGILLLRPTAARTSPASVATNCRTTLVGRIVFDERLARSQRRARVSTAIRSTTTTGAWTPVLKPGALLGRRRRLAGVVYVSDVAVQAGHRRAGRRRRHRLARRLELQRLLRIDRRRPDVQPAHGRRRAQRQGPRPDVDRVVGRTARGSTRSSSRRRCSTTPRPTSGGTILQGIYASTSGFAGPWNKIAEWRNLANGGSALEGGSRVPPGRPGLVQPVPRGRPGRTRTTSTSGSRRSSSPPTVAASWTRRRPVLELRHALLDGRRPGQLPDDDPSGPARDRDRRRHGLRRQRRRRLQPIAHQSRRSTAGRT